MPKNIKSISDLSTCDVKRLYNIGKIIRQKDLPKLAKTYKDNLRTLIVYMDRKTTKPEQMPEWFKKWNKEVYESQPPKWFSGFAQKQEKFNKSILERLINLETLVYTVIKVNNLKIS